MEEKKVAILGFKEGVGGWAEAPFDDDSFEIWGMNHLEISGFNMPDVFRYNRWFEMHTIYNIRHRYLKMTNGQKIVKYDHLKWLKKYCKAPIYMPKKYKAIKNSIEYPIDRMIEKHGPVFTNTVDYEIALAIDEGYKEIHLYGLAFQYIDEVWTQRLSIAYFMGFVKGMGIKFYVPLNHNVLRINNIYGYPKKDIEPDWKYM